MNISLKHVTVALLASVWIAWGPAAASAPEDEVAALRQEFDAASFETTGRAERKEAFRSLVEHAAQLRERYPDDAEVVAWEGIVLSTYAGEVGAMSAMKYAKAALAALNAAKEMDPRALDGGVHASLGVLYSKVPGGLIGFGDDEAAERYFNEALQIDATSIDANYFYGEFLLGQGRYEQAVAVLRRGLEAPTVSSRPAFDAARRAQMRTLLETAERETRS